MDKIAKCCRAKKKYLMTKWIAKEAKNKMNTKQLLLYTTSYITFWKILILLLLAL